MFYDEDGNPINDLGATGAGYLAGNLAGFAGQPAPSYGTDRVVTGDPWATDYLNGIATANPNYVPTAADSIGDIDPNGYFTDYQQPSAANYRADMLQPGEVWSDPENFGTGGPQQRAMPGGDGPATYTADPGSAPTGEIAPEVVTPLDLDKLYANNYYSRIADDELANAKALAEQFRNSSVTDAYKFQEQELARINANQAQRRAAVEAQVAAELQSVGAWETTSLADLKAEVDRRMASEDEAKGVRLTGLEGYLGAYRDSLDNGLRKDQERFASLLGATGLVGKAARQTYDARNSAELAIGMERGAKTMPILDQWLAGREGAQQFGYGGRVDVRNQATQKRDATSRWKYGETSSIDTDAYGQRKGAYGQTAAKVDNAQNNYGNSLNTYLTNYYNQRRTGVADQDNKINYQVGRADTAANNALNANNDAANANANAAGAKGDIYAASKIAQGNAFANGAEGVAGAIGDWYAQQRRANGGSSGGYLNPVNNWGSGGTSYQF